MRTLVWHSFRNVAAHAEHMHVSIIHIGRLNRMRYQPLGRGLCARQVQPEVYRYWGLRHVQMKADLQCYAGQDKLATIPRSEKLW
jgi:hypothetical protein